MADTAPERTTLRTGIARHPLAPILLPVPIVCFVGALLTDFVYENSGGNLLWVNFSSWLLAAGLLFAGITIVLWAIDLARLPELRFGDGWAGFALLIAAWVVELINSFVHARDGWTAVVPLGLALSAIGALQILAVGLLWHETRYEGDWR